MFRRCKLVYTGGGIRSASKRPASLRASLLIEPLETRDLLNAAPTIGGLVFDNPHPQTSDMLQVQVVDVVDLDADPLLFQFDWRVNGQTVRLHSSSTASDVLDLSQPGLGSGAEGTEITVTVLGGFDANAGLTVDFNGNPVTILQQGNVVQPGNLQTDANGRATFTIRLDRNYPRFGRINPRTLEPEGYQIRVTSGTGQNTVFAYAHYIVTR